MCIFHWRNISVVGNVWEDIWAIFKDLSTKLTFKVYMIINILFHVCFNNTIMFYKISPDVIYNIHVSTNDSTEYLTNGKVLSLYYCY